MKLLSMVVEIYNEEKCLPFCLASMLPYVDECIIVDGSENGRSTDRTFHIVRDFIEKSEPGKIIYFTGTFRRDDGAWDDTAQNNAAFERVTGKFLMRTHADIIYDNMAALRAIVQAHQDRKVFYCPMIEFFYDTNHIRLYPHGLEELLPRPLVGDLPVIAMSLNPRFEDLGEHRRSSLQADAFGCDDIIYMPHVKRFHYGWVKPFREQVLKHVRYIKRGDHEEHGGILKAKGEKAMFDWTIEHVLNYKDDPSKFIYAGEYPSGADELLAMTSMDGYEKFMNENMA